MSRTGNRAHLRCVVKLQGEVRTDGVETANLKEAVMGLMKWVALHHVFESEHSILRI